AMALRSTEITMHGDLAAAEQLARGAMLRGHELDQISDGAYFLQRFVVRYQQARLAEEAPMLREASAVSTVYRAGAALHPIALDDTDSAIDHFAEASAIAHRLRAPYWIAQSAVDAAAARRARRRADDEAKADRLLAEAIVIAESHGYGRVLEQAKRFR